MSTRLLNIRYNGDGLYSFLYEDGLRAELDFNGFPGEPWTDFTACFRSEDFLSKAYLDHGVMTWPNSYDICPDVLRFWCEEGRITAQTETNAHFAPA